MNDNTRYKIIMLKKDFKLRTDGKARIMEDNPLCATNLGVDVRISAANNGLRDIDTSAPSMLEHDLKEIGLIYIDNQDFAFPDQKDDIDQINLEGLCRLFKRYNAKKEHQFVVLKGGIYNTVYGFTWIGPPLKDDLTKKIGKDANVLHALYGDKDFHGQMIPHFMWKKALTDIIHAPDLYKREDMHTLVSKANERSIRKFKALGATIVGEYDVTTLSKKVDRAVIMHWPDIRELKRLASPRQIATRNIASIPESEGGDAVPYTPPPEQYR